MADSAEFKGFEDHDFQRKVAELERAVSNADPLIVSSIVAEFIVPALGVVAKHPTFFNERLTYSERAAEEIKEAIFSLKRYTEESAANLFRWVYRIIVEVVYRADEITRSVPGPVNGLKSLISRVRYNDIRHGQLIDEMMIYPDRYLPADVVQELLEKPDFKAMSDFRKEYSKLDEQIEALKLRQEQVKALGDTLEKYKIKFNFVGLHEGFERIARKKRTSSLIHMVVLFFLFLLMVGPFAFKAWLLLNPSSAMAEILAYHLSNSLSRDATIGMVSVLSDRNLGLLLLAVGYELLMLYFFKVVFSGYRSVQAQLVQLELRMTLCQFIQHYTEYSKVMNKESPGVLERFEQLIFSSIVANEDQIPSSFDGLDQIVKLMGQLKSGKP